MVAIYLDDCMADHRLARRLRAAGPPVYLPSERDVAQLPIAAKVAYLERAARLLTTASAEGQLMMLALFDTEQRGHAYVTSLTPPPPHPA